MFPLLSSLLLHTSAKIIGLTVVSRHGTRAANRNILDICPNYAPSLKWYTDDMQVAPGGLTPKGMYDIYMMGDFTRKTYVESGFLDRVWKTRDSFTQAVGVDRTIQSAVLFLEALYPAGSAPELFPVKGIPAPVPIFVVPVDQDDLLEARVASCEAQIAYDTRLWDRSIGIQLLEKHVQVFKDISNICGKDVLEMYPLADVRVGSPAYNLADALKDITDAMTFDYDQLASPLPGIGITPMPGLTSDSFAAYRDLAIDMLFGRLYSTEEKVNYMVGKLPLTLINNFEAAIAGNGKIWAYHGHREMTYALAKFLGIDFDIHWPDLPKRAIPASTTLYFELHHHTRSSTETFQNITVRAYIWLPNYEVRTVATFPMVNPVVMKFCGQEYCPWEQFKEYVMSRINAFGSITELCTDGIADHNHKHTPSKWMPDPIPDEGSNASPAAPAAPASQSKKRVVAREGQLQLAVDAGALPTPGTGSARYGYAALLALLVVPGLAWCWAKHRVASPAYEAIQDLP